MGSADRPPALVGVEPQLFVADIAASLRYYRDCLGFSQVFAHGDPPFYSQVLREGVRLNLRHVDRPVFDRGLRAAEDLLSATIVVEGIDALFAEFERRGARFHQALRCESWGARTFIISDPDGNLVAFAGD